MSTWKRLSNLGKAKLKEGLGSVARADRDGGDIAALRELERELKAERDRGEPISDDVVGRARQLRERLEAARAGTEVGTRLDGDPPTSRPGGSGAKDAAGYEPPGPPEKMADGTVKRTL